MQILLDKQRVPTSSFEEGYTDFLKEPTCYETGLAYQLWHEAADQQRRRGQDVIPRRIDLDMARLGPILPKVYLLDIVDGGRDYHFRMLGSDVVSMIGSNPQGKKLSAIGGANWGRSGYDAVSRSRVPQIRRAIVHSPASNASMIEMVILPVCDRYNRFNIIMVAFSVIN